MYVYIFLVFINIKMFVLVWPFFFNHLFPISIKIQKLITNIVFDKPSVYCRKLSFVQCDSLKNPNHMNTKCEFFV